MFNKDEKLEILRIFSFIILGGSAYLYSLSTESFWAKFPLLWLATFSFFSILPEKGIIKLFKKILEAPISILIVIFSFIKPISILLFSAILSIGIPFSIVLILENQILPFYGLSISKEASSFISLLFIFTVATIFCKKIVRWCVISQKSTYELLTEKDDKLDKSEEFVIEIFNIDNLRFIIYTIYLISYLFLSFEIENQVIIFKTSDLGRAIIGSFVCYIALERIINARKNIKLDRKRIFRKYIESILEDLGKLTKTDKESNQEEALQSPSEETPSQNPSVPEKGHNSSQKDSLSE